MFVCVCVCVFYWNGMRVCGRGLFLYEQALQQTMRSQAGKRIACLMDVVVV